jgi:hypothetical protein
LRDALPGFTIVFTGDGSLRENVGGGPMSFLTNKKGASMDDSGSYVWFHGSPRDLKTLGAGSAITRNRKLAEAFSHKPALLEFGGDGTIRHTGVEEGFLYQVDEPLGEGDVVVHPGIRRSDPWEWTTQRDLRLRLVGPTVLTRSERMGPLRAAVLRAGAKAALLLRRGRK